MTITVNAVGTERKRLVNTISNWMGTPATYCGAPTFNYEVDYLTIDKNGSISFDDNLADSETIERLLQHLYDEGFAIDMSADDSSDEEDTIGICISMPTSLFTLRHLQNLKDILDAKGDLIKKAFGIDALPVEINEKTVSFPWFLGTHTPEEIKAYDTFICKLCDLARNLQRVNAKDKTVENDKYAFRCFLLRLGFIGSEYKTERKILLRNLEGSSAFKSAKEVNE